MPYLTNPEEHELKLLRTKADVGILCDVERWAAKGTRSSSIGYWGEEGVLGYGFELRVSLASAAYIFPSNYWDV